jgi:hypothetical protein
MQNFLSRLDYPGKDQQVVSGADPLIVGSPKHVLREDIGIDDWSGA